MTEERKHLQARDEGNIEGKPPTKAQKRNKMSTYLKNMTGFKHSQLKSKRDELEFDKSKKQKIDEHVKAEKDDDLEEEEMKKHMEIVQDEEEIVMGIDREDLETLWKLVNEKHGINKPVDEYESVLWGDLKVMFEPDIKSDVWRNL
ncbi:hypothetical protein Tco_1500847 [Tanacetum coccineum]